MGLDHLSVIKWIMNAQDDGEDVRLKLEFATKWFGVRQVVKMTTIGKKFTPSLFVTDRYKEISLAGLPNRRYPCLVSFIGETGNGKSTTINALIKVSSYLRISLISYIESSPAVFG